MKRLVLLLFLATSAFAQTATNDNRGAIVPSATGAYTITTTGTGTTLASNPTFSLNSQAAGRDVSMRFYDGTNAWYIDMLSNALIYSQLVAGVATERMRVDASGNVGIGGAPLAKLDVLGANTKGNTIASWNIESYDTRSASTGTGGGIVFGGWSNASTTAAVFGSIEGAKSNATPGNISGDLVLKSATSGGVLTEAARFDTAQNTILAGTLKERSRATPMGEWIAFTPTITPTAGTWTPTITTTARYTLVGKTMTMAIAISGNQTVAPGLLQVQLPGGFTAGSAQRSVGRFYNGAVWSPSLVYTSGAGGSGVYCASAIDGSNIAIGNGQTLEFTFTFEIQ